VSKLDWIWDNRQWLFSGAGFAVIGFLWWLIKLIANGTRRNSQGGNTQEPSPTTNSLPKGLALLGLLVLVIGAAYTLGLREFFAGLLSNDGQSQQEESLPAGKTNLVAAKAGSRTQQRGTLLLAAASVKYGEVPFRGGTRTGYWPEEGFALASATAVRPEMADFYIVAPGEAPPGGIHVGGVSRLEFEMTREGSEICPLGPIDFDGLAEAPDPKKKPGYSQTGVPVRTGEVYCFSLDEGKFWGKLRIVTCEGSRSRGIMTFEYVLQRNGTRKLAPSQPPQ
jgi:hypothetical protein